MIIEISDTTVKMQWSPSDVYAWSHRPGARWPCATMDYGYEKAAAKFDADGLLDLEVQDIADWGYEESRAVGEDISSTWDGTEFSAFTADALVDHVPLNHPCRYIAVDQHLAEDRGKGAS